jgi:hypothetical protein
VAALCLAFGAGVPQAAIGQVPAPAVVFTRTTDVPSRVVWGGGAEREDRVAGGVIIGALVGAGVGFVVGQAACSKCDDPAPVLAVTGLGAALGAVVGFFIGWRSPGG